MKISQRGIDLIKEFEGFRAAAYRCPAGVLTIGYGHTSGVYEGQKVTKAEAEKMLRQDLVQYETAVTAWNYLYGWTQPEFDSLVSFTYNCGTGSLRNLLKGGTRNRYEIRKAMVLYTKDIHGNTLAGLVRRRKAELELFNSDYDTDTGNGAQAPEKDYETVDDIVKGIWAGDFGTPWSQSNLLYKYFMKKVNEYKGG